jgi:hypothetical protein
MVNSDHNEIGDEEMRAQVTIEHILLSDGMMKVTFLDGHEKTVEMHTVHNDDAEYQLLAKAIDRFVTVQRNLRDLKAAELESVSERSE